MKIQDWKRLVKAARPLYADTGSNSWGHIQAVVRQGERMVGAVKHRQLTTNEAAALLFHDCAVKERGGNKEHHAELSAMRAIVTLAGILGGSDIAEVGWAIAQHDDKDREKDGDLADLVAAADFSPMDITFIIKKSYQKNLAKLGEDKFRQAAEATWIYVRKAYGTHSQRLFPRLYKAFYGDQIASVAEFIDALEPRQILALVGKGEYYD